MRMTTVSLTSLGKQTSTSDKFTISVMEDNSQSTQSFNRKVGMVANRHDFAGELLINFSTVSSEMG